jgi:murein DD-endopeptidase MepM/ murein hydrolase activator NlpD
VSGETLKSARHAIRAAGYRVGSIKRVFSSEAKRGRVVSQRPQAHTQLRNGAKVSLVLSKGLSAEEAYTDPLRAIRDLSRGRIDMGVDYAGYGPLRALGDAVVTFASNHDGGPPGCWGRTCWPGGGVVVYKLTAGPLAGKYVYAAENVAVAVHRGQTITAGQKIATLRPGFPHLETGWASGRGPEALAIARGQQCTCGDPGGWSTVEGRNFDRLLVSVGAPAGYLQLVPRQAMPRRWPKIAR